jgi:hypothetical protein
MKTRRRPRRRWQITEAKAGKLRPSAAIDELKILAAAKRPPRLQPKWNADDNGLIVFVQRALNVAVIDASAAAENNRRRVESETWKTVETKARRAHAAIEALLRVVGSERLPPTNTVVSGLRVPKSWAPSGKLRVGLVLGPIPTGAASNEVDVLKHAKVVIQSYQEQAKKRLAFQALNSHNPGDPGKTVFLHRLAEAWISLTGKRPGKSPNPNTNPFLRFVLAAWKDAGFVSSAYEEPDFASALNSSLKRFAMLEYFKGDTVATPAAIATRGPVWADA